MLEECVVVVHFAPDPRWEAHKKSILSHTVFRQNEHIKGSLGDESPKHTRHDDEVAETLTKLLKYDNGDVRAGLGAIVHHEVGCCPGGIVQTRDNLFAAFLEANLLLNKDVSLPSANRWGTVDAALGDPSQQNYPRLHLLSLSPFRKCLECDSHRV
jgi:hypothetical protein